ncbi:hypothetical protein F4819DRAFT_74356 [Hypoxylon fuscum]|nr:hypothetical protein F4819DRAFT_74356 [Hypoxylon fuscum]
MSTISRLPESTTRLLGSPIVIATPAILIKELLENSIDAKATSIEVVVSANTVKRIEIRDNGTGIHPDDFDALGRRGHTSKLRNFEELRTHFGKVLGFRGEALASANSLAHVTITTKVASEPVATILHIMPGVGGVSQQHPTSAPVGTTVSIADLFGQLPVREQVAIKDSAKTIDSIRDLLRSYAMARPYLRLSFKVLQSAKQSWSYSPKPNASVREAAVQLFGAELTNHCLEKSYEIGGLLDGSDSAKGHQILPPNGHYVFETFVLKPGADPSKVPKQRYFSVDGRPVTARRGTMKRLLGIYVDHISAAFQRHSSATKLKDCFLRLNIKCPPGSYDANIEPSKDDVLFSDEHIVLNGFKGICDAVYEPSAVEDGKPQLESKSNFSSDIGRNLGGQASLSLKPRLKSEPQDVKSTDPSLHATESISQPQLTTQVQQQPSIATRQLPAIRLRTTDLTDLPEPSPVLPGFTQTSVPDLSTQVEYSSEGASFPKNVPTSIGHNQWKVDMSTDCNEHSHYRPRGKCLPPVQATLSSRQTPDVVEYSAPRDVNPWVIAKMNAPNHKVGKRAVKKPFYQETQERSPLPTFEPSTTPEPPILRHPEAAPRDLDVLPSQRYSQDNNHRPRPWVPGGAYRSPISSPLDKAPWKASGSSPMPTTLKPRHHRNYPPWSPPSSVGKTGIRDELPGNTDQPAQGGMKQTTISSIDTRDNGRKRRLQENGGESTQQELGDEGRLRENDHRHMFTSARRNPNHQTSQPKSALQSQRPPHHSCVNPEVRQDHPYAHAQNEGCSSKVKEPIQTTLPSDDPRAYLLRRQKSIAAEEREARPRKLRRLKSSLLPLENVPKLDQIHFLVLVEVVDVEILRTSVSQGALYGKYVEIGSAADGLEMSLPDARKVEARLRSLLRPQNDETRSGEEAELEINLCSLLKGKRTKASS